MCHRLFSCVCSLTAIMISSTLGDFGVGLVVWKCQVYAASKTTRQITRRQVIIMKWDGTVKFGWSDCTTGAMKVLCRVLLLVGDWQWFGKTAMVTATMTTRARADNQSKFGWRWDLSEGCDCITGEDTTGVETKTQLKTTFPRHNNICAMKSVQLEQNPTTQSHSYGNLSLHRHSAYCCPQKLSIDSTILWTGEFLNR